MHLFNYLKVAMASLVLAMVVFCSCNKVDPNKKDDINPYKGIQFISDHWPVYIDFSLE